MKFLVVLFAMFVLAYGQETTAAPDPSVVFDGEKYPPKTIVRDLPADVLRGNSSFTYFYNLGNRIKTYLSKDD